MIYLYYIIRLFFKIVINNFSILQKDIAVYFLTYPSFLFSSFLSIFLLLKQRIEIPPFQSFLHPLHSLSSNSSPLYINPLPISSNPPPPLCSFFLPFLLNLTPPSKPFYILSLIIRILFFSPPISLSTPLILLRFLPILLPTSTIFLSSPQSFLPSQTFIHNPNPPPPHQSFSHPFNPSSFSLNFLPSHQIVFPCQIIFYTSPIFPSFSTFLSSTSIPFPYSRILLPPHQSFSQPSSTSSLSSNLLPTPLILQRRKKISLSPPFQFYLNHPFITQDSSSLSSNPASYLSNLPLLFAILPFPNSRFLDPLILLPPP